MTSASVDAIVVGAGPNGLVAANILADAGWEVLVLEAQPEPGGAVRSAELIAPGFVNDRFSAFYPLAAVSPALTRLHLEDHGLTWCKAETPLAHVFDDGRAAVISLDLDQTAASVDRFAAGDGDAWRQLVEEWQQVADPLVAALLGPYPPVAASLRLAARLRRPHAVLALARMALLPVRRLASERFRGVGGAMLLAGNTLHTDLTPDSALGGFYGWLLAMLAQTVGFPVPRGGSGSLTAALVRRLQAAGGTVRCGAEVTAVVVEGGRATGVRLGTGEQILARRGVAADVVASTLYRSLVGTPHLPERLRHDLDQFQLDHGTFKVDWALREPIPWRDQQARSAGTLHLGEGMDHLTAFAADLAAGRLPARPFVLFGQMGRADASRSPGGTETAWAYTHVPNTAVRSDAPHWDRQATDVMLDRIEQQIETRAPGFRDIVLGRHVSTPADLQASNANLVGGAINGGTGQLHQQLVFRPTLGRGGPGTPVPGLFLASSSAHPGGGVHGACGANAARAMLRDRRRHRRP